MFTTTRKETTVDILAQTPETFDAILKAARIIQKNLFNNDLRSFISIF